jgi:site-specific DNA-methyltransferase (adenine-specific)
MNETPRNTILVGDTLSRLRTLASDSVDLVVSSPPWFLQRDYGVSGQIGLERNVTEWVDQLRAVVGELKRVLAPHGSLVLDLGDTYSSHPKFGAPAKSLLLAPQRLILALIQDGWLVRNQIIWNKTNPMPDAVTDRLSNTYDMVFHLVKQPHYYYDLDAVRPLEQSGLVGKNPGDLVRLPAGNFRGAHFATFPERLVELPIQTSSPWRVCTSCNKPWRREVGRVVIIGKRTPPGKDPKVRRYRGSWRTLRQLGEIKPSCVCDALARPGLVLDPFLGSGTVARVAQRLGRDWLGIELNPVYVAIARERINQHAPPLLEAA